jgi:hypothetical protein
MKNRFGPTGDFPRGKLNAEDEGGLQIGIAKDHDGVIVINFGTEVSWIGLDQASAISFAKHILKHAGVKKVELEF